MSQKPKISEPQFDPSKTPKCANISASRTKFKIRLDGSKCSLLGNYHAKFGVSSMFRLGCRGGSKMLLHILYSEETCTQKPNQIDDPNLFPNPTKILSPNSGYSHLTPNSYSSIFFCSVATTNPMYFKCFVKSPSPLKKFLEKSRRRACGRRGGGRGGERWKRRHKG